MEGQPPKPQNDEQVTDDATAEPSGAATPELPGNQATGFVSSTPQEDSKNNRFSNESKTNEGVSTSNTSLHQSGQWGQNENVEVIPSEREGFDSLNHSLGKFSISNEPPKNATTFNSAGNQNQHENATLLESGRVADSSVRTDESEEKAPIDTLHDSQSSDEEDSWDSDSTSTENSESSSEDEDQNAELGHPARSNASTNMSGGIVASLAPYPDQVAHGSCDAKRNEDITAGQDKEKKPTSKEIQDRLEVLSDVIKELKKKIFFFDEVDDTKSYQKSPEYERYFKKAIEDGRTKVKKWKLRKKIPSWENNVKKLSEAAQKMRSETKEWKDFVDELKDIESEIFTLEEIDPTNFYQMPSDDEMVSTDVISDDDHYPIRMEGKRGIFLVFCHMVFKDPELGTLNGTLQACKDLKKTWSSGFEFVIKWNATKKNVTTIIKKFAEEFDHSRYDCFACAIMTHGEKKDKVFAFNDGQNCSYHVKKICQKFEHCTTLDGIPKLFFIQACRGKKCDYGMKVNHPNANISAKGNAERNIQKTIAIPKKADFLIAFATTEGYVSWVNVDRGPLFNQALNECVKSSSSYDMLTILTATIEAVANEPIPSKRENEEERINKQCPTILSRLRKSFSLKRCVTKTQSTENSSVYKKSELPKVFLILTQEYSENSPPKNGEKDIVNLKEDWEKLGFEVVSKTFDNKKSIIKTLKKSAEDYQEYGCFACAVLLFEPDTLFARKKFSFKKILQPFIDSRHWVRKPKLFFIQADINEISMSSTSEEKKPQISNKLLWPEEADILVMFTSDSSFIERLTKCIKENHKLDLLTILTKLIREIGNQEINQCPTIVSRLTSPFYFEKTEQAVLP